jgi:lysophospholipase L1-like esterase
MLGSNDLLQGLSAKSTAVRMLRFISKLTLERDKILLIFPPAFKNGMWISDEKMLEHSAQLWQFYSEVSSKTGVHFANAADWDIPLCYDGVHFTENGHKIFAENIYKMIIKIKEK